MLNEDSDEESVFEGFSADDCRVREIESDLDIDFRKCGGFTSHSVSTPDISSDEAKFSMLNFFEKPYPSQTS
jgi:hypothetical protein